MDPKDLPPMRSGLGLPSERRNASLELTKRRLIAAVVVMTRQAAESAWAWNAHNTRAKTPEGADSRDVEIALKHQARHFVGTLDDPAVVQEILETERALFSEDSSDDDTGDEDDSQDSQDGSQESQDGSQESQDGLQDSREGSQELQDSQLPDAAGAPSAGAPSPGDKPSCACETCAKMWDSYNTWDAWTPEDEIHAYLKARVDMAVQRVQDHQQLTLEMDI